jgi:hypothetical protein
MRNIRKNNGTHFFSNGTEASKFNVSWVGTGSANNELRLMFHCQTTNFIVIEAFSFSFETSSVAEASRVWTC